MDSTTPSSMPSDDGGRPGGDAPRSQRAAGTEDAASTERTRGAESTADSQGASGEQDAPRSRDVLEKVAAKITALEMSEEGRALLAQVLSAAFVAFTDTRSVRDPLPDTAAGSPEEALAVLAGLDHLRSSLAAMGATWQVAAEQRIRQADRSRGVATKDQGRGAAQETALARRISPAASSFSLASSRRLIQHMPGTVDSLWEGALTAEQASTVAGALDGASPATCARIDEIIRENPETLQGKGKKRLRSDVEQLVQQLEPETSRERAERAARRRHVTMTPLADGMARVTAVLRAIDATGMMQSLNSRAQSLRASGEKTSVPALEADLLVDAVRVQHARPDAASRPPRPTPGLDVGIVITDTALLDGSDDGQSARLEGYGTLPAHIVTDTLLGRPPGHLRHQDEEKHPDEEVSAFYRRLYTGPRPGELVAMDSQARAFPAGLARILRWRDTTCRTPWCNARIRHCDHVVPVQRGGDTSYANGQGLCVRCNLLKEHGLWKITPLDPDTPEPPGPSEFPEPAEPPGPSAGSAPSDPSEQPTNDTPERPPSSTPPAAWFWRSPHGAQGISVTPRLFPPSSSREPEGTKRSMAHEPAGDHDEPDTTDATDATAESAATDATAESAESAESADDSTQARPAPEKETEP